MDTLWDNFYKNITENTIGIIVSEVFIIYSLHSLERERERGRGKAVNLQIIGLRYISGGY